MALKGSFSTLMATLAPFGNYDSVKLLTKVNFALAKLVLGLAETFVEDIKDFFGQRQ